MIFFIKCDFLADKNNRSSITGCLLIFSFKSESLIRKCGSRVLILYTFYSGIKTFPTFIYDGKAFVISFRKRINGIILRGISVKIVEIGSSGKLDCLTRFVLTSICKSRHSKRNGQSRS